MGGRAMRLEQAEGQALRLRHTWDVAACEIAHLGSCHLGKYPWEVATWEKSFEKSILHHIFYIIEQIKV